MAGLQAAGVFAGAGMGALLRWRIGLWAALLWPSFPAGTAIVNLAGSFLAGAAAGFLESRPELPAEVRLVLMTGFLGGFTTFSAFSLEMVLMAQEKPALAAAVTAGKAAVCLALAFAGLALARKF